jgi:DNA-binding response OmpR family regulator
MNELERLQAENDALREQIRRLRFVLRSSARTPAKWHLSRLEQRIWLALVATGFQTKEQLHAAMYFDRHGEDEPDLKMIGVMICKLRAKLRPFGVTIETHWGHGYGLDATTRDFFKGQGDGDAIRDSGNRASAQQGAHRARFVHALKAPQGQR